jgi:hypothetical protein
LLTLKKNSHAHEEDIPGTVNLQVAGKFPTEVFGSAFADPICEQLGMTRHTVRLFSLCLQKIQMIPSK